MVHKIRPELEGKRLARTCAGWRCHVDKIAESANCSEGYLQEIVDEANKRTRYYRRRTSWRGYQVATSGGGQDVTELTQPWPRTSKTSSRYTTIYLWMGLGPELSRS